MSNASLNKVGASLGNFDNIARANFVVAPTLIEHMPHLSEYISQANLYVKRDDYTGPGLGGNKVRQLEFYLGDALAKEADTVLITGATQSNFARLTAACARKSGMECHIQIENRVANNSSLYHHSGNVLLSRMFGAHLHAFPEGENEDGADRNLEEIASRLNREGKSPYVIHLGSGHPPLGALGYVAAAHELVHQLQEGGHNFDAIIVPSGSGATHAGLLFGLRALGCTIPVRGICVRRAKELQHERIQKHLGSLAQLLGIENPTSEKDIDLSDDVLAPGYGMINASVLEAIRLTARKEGIILDPVYSGRAMAGFLDYAKQSSAGEKLLFLHTGGAPAVFGYESVLAPVLSDNI